MKITTKILVAFMALALTAAASYSETSNFITANPDGQCGRKSDHTKCGAADKAQRGINNMLFGWTDIPKSIFEVTRDSGNPVYGLTGGTLKGVGKAFPRTVSGISDVLSSPMDDSDTLRPDQLNKQLR
jgi:putative exosortase-associated protein (TIGR04073 family)